MTHFPGLSICSGIIKEDLTDALSLFQYTFINIGFDFLNDVIKEVKNYRCTKILRNCEL